MQSLHTKDLVNQRDLVKNEIRILEAKIVESRMRLGIFESAITRSEEIDKEQSTKENPPKIITQSNISNGEYSIEERVVVFLSKKSNQSARASEITESIGEGNRDANMRVYNSISALIKQGKIQIVKEYDSTGSERQRNRLYQVTPLV